MKSVTRWFVLPRFDSYKPTPRWGGHKDRVSFNTFPLSNGHLDRVSFSPQSIGTLSHHKDHHSLVSLALITKNLETRNGEEEKRSKRKSSKEHDKTLSSSHYCFEWNWDLERFWFILIVSCIECTSSCIKCVGWKLGCLKVWWLGVFIAPTTKVAVGEGCCRRTVRCASYVTQPLGFDRWSFWQLGHRTVRWCTGQSGGAPDSHCSLSGAPSSACSDSARAVRALFTFADDRWRC
jgi:hypothetical protein